MPAAGRGKYVRQAGTDQSLNQPGNRLTQLHPRRGVDARRRRHLRAVATACSGGSEHRIQPAVRRHVDDAINHIPGGRKTRTAGENEVLRRRHERMRAERDCRPRETSGNRAGTGARLVRRRHAGTVLRGTAGDLSRRHLNRLDTEPRGPRGGRERRLCNRGLAGGGNRSNRHQIRATENLIEQRERGHAGNRDDGRLMKRYTPRFLPQTGPDARSRQTQMRAASRHRPITETAGGSSDTTTPLAGRGGATPETSTCWGDSVFRRVRTPHPACRAQTRRRRN